MFFAPSFAVVIGKVLAETIINPHKFPNIPKPKPPFPIDVKYSDKKGL